MSTPHKGVRLAREWFEHNSGWAPPDDDTLAEWVADGVCRCPDDCIVAPDATCAHGLASWFTIMEAQRTEDERRSSGKIEYVILLIVALVFGAAFYWAGTHSPDDNKKDAAIATTDSSVAVATTLPPPRRYKASGGVNVRTGPGTKFPVMGTVELGNDLIVVCRTEGESVSNGPTPTNLWLQISIEGKAGFVSAAFVDTRGDLNNAAVIGVCPPA